MKQFIKQHWKLFTVIIIFSIIEGLLIVGGESLTSVSIDYAIAHNMKMFWVIFGCNVVMWLLIVIIVYVRHSLIYKIEYRMKNHLRKIEMANLLNLDYKSFNEKEVGSYVSNFTNDINLVGGLILKPMFDIIELVSLIIFSIIMIGLVSWFILVVMLVLSIATISIPKLFAKKLNYNNTKILVALETFTSKAKNLLSCFDVIYNYNLFNSSKQKMLTMSDELEKTKYKKEIFQNFNTSILIISSSINMILCLALIVILSTRKDFETGWILGLSLLVPSFYVSLNHTNKSIVALAGVKPFLKKFKLNSSEIWNSQKPLSPLENSLTLENISLELNNKLVVQDINMKFENNKNYAIVGPSGVGKTTIFKIITLFYNDYKGDIKWDKQILSKEYIRALNERICYISQDNFLFSKSIKANIILDQEFDLTKMKEVIKLSGLEDFINNDQDYDKEIKNNGANLSGGQKQRLVIARGLYHNKKIFLLDEATSAIDKLTSEKIELNLLKNKDFTVIVISHHLSEKIKSCLDKIYTIPEIIGETENNSINK